MKPRVQSSLASVMFCGFLAASLQGWSGCASVRGHAVPSPPDGGQNQARISAEGSHEELWIFARSASSAPAESTPGFGSVRTMVEGAEHAILPRRTEVHARIEGCVGAVEVSQKFINAFSNSLDGRYVFSLPPDSALNEFMLSIGERRIRAVVRERKEAEALYREARVQGYTASLLNEERPNRFSQSLGNLKPGSQLDFKLNYVQRIPFDDGWFEFAFPMTSPRPNGPSDSGSPPALALTLDIRPGFAVEGFECNSHDAAEQISAPDHLVVSLRPTNSLPEGDFVCRYRIAGAHVRSNLLTSGDEGGRFFLLSIYPPGEIDSLPRLPIELVFVLDCSAGSNGALSQQARSAVGRALQLLHPADGFQLITFSPHASKLAARPLLATPENIHRALGFLDAMESGQKGSLLAGLEESLDPPADSHRERIVCLLTDRAQRDEAAAVRLVHNKLGAAHLFTIGLGPSSSRFSLESLARAGRGAATFIGPRDDVSEIMERFVYRISHVALTDLSINWGSLSPVETYPAQLPDLYPGRSLLIAGRFTGSIPSGLSLSANAGGQKIEFPIRVTTAAPGAARALAVLWARMKLADLVHQSLLSPEPALLEQIKQTALDYGLPSSFSSLLAVDTLSTTNASGKSKVTNSKPETAFGKSPNQN